MKSHFAAFMCEEMCRDYGGTRENMSNECQTVAGHMDNLCDQLNQCSNAAAAANDETLCNGLTAEYYRYGAAYQRACLTSYPVGLCLGDNIYP